MKRPVFIARQSARPSGLLGRVIAEVMARETANLNEEAIRLLAPASTDWMLEVGFGHGRTVERLAARVTKGGVCGLDVSETMLAMAVRRNRQAIAVGRVDLRCADCAAIPFSDGRFDGALTVHTIYFWDDPALRLLELRRVLRPGGRLVLGFMRGGSLNRKSFPTEVYAFYEERDVETMLAAAGFEAPQFRRIGEASLALAAATSVST